MGFLKVFQEMFTPGFIHTGILWTISVIVIIAGVINQFIN